MAGGSLDLGDMSLLVYYILGINLFTFLIYGYDKYRSKRKGNRVPERALHILAFIGGSPGAFIAQSTFRHKTIKRRFQMTYWFIVCIQIALLVCILFVR